jgi:NAD-dependent dihydropyrimidine dehydrogenase PreA subunit
MAGNNEINKDRHILLCNCNGERISSDLLSALDSYLRKMPVSVTKVNDLCGIVKKDKETITQLFAGDTGQLVIGCYKRTLNLLLEQAGVESSDISFLNLIETGKDQVFNQIAEFCNGHTGDHVFSEISEDSGWPSWYPVIDYSRCTSCGQCADFCLFGVYDKTGKEVRVINPESCKNNCPACARICPSTAIIFPKYKHGGAIGGSAEIDEQAELRRQSQDIEDFLGNDIYSAIEKRKVKRQSIIRQEAMNKAISERENALRENKNKNSTDVII